MSGGAAVSVPPGMTAKNLADVVTRVATASQKASRAALPRLVAVSKTKPVGQLKECYDAGHRYFGENYVQAGGCACSARGVGVVKTSRAGMEGGRGVAEGVRDTGAAGSRPSHHPRREREKEWSPR